MVVSGSAGVLARIGLPPRRAMDMLAGRPRSRIRSTIGPILHIIPVIDLKAGRAVHARMGRRHTYRPVASPLSPDGDALALLDAYLRVHPFDTVYVADLDAIAGTGDNGAVLRRMRAVHPEIARWIDAGGAETAGSDLSVIGTESLADDAALAAILHAAGPDGFALSLDRHDGDILGPASIHEDSRLWPGRVVAMALSRVGSGAGPDVEGLAALVARAGGRHIYAAGGVRDAGDLAGLAAAGAAGALVATALHDGRLTGADLAGLGAR
jgi:phosphoribosylformimino-5-aminoimidazole carboxamide ribotide isomerase